MRIISGDYKGFVLNPPSNLPVRPTTDRAKEALFSILANQFDFESVSVLELFAGTGNISFEFLSRGVSELTLVEKHPKCIRFIQETLDKLEVTFVEVIQRDVYQYLGTSTKQYDLIFLDPPYLETNYLSLTSKILNLNLLKENGLLIAEHLKTTQLQSIAGYQETRNYGESAFSFFEKMTNSE